MFLTVSSVRSLSTSPRMSYSLKISLFMRSSHP
jgi:hypothetical protein